MTITVNKDASDLIKALSGKENTLTIASRYDYGIETEVYMTLGIKYLHTNNKYLKKRIIDYLCEINFHSSHEALKKNSFYDYVKAF